MTAVLTGRPSRHAISLSEYEPKPCGPFVENVCGTITFHGCWHVARAVSVGAWKPLSDVQAFHWAGNPPTAAAVDRRYLRRPGTAGFDIVIGKLVEGARN